MLLLGLELWLLSACLLLASPEASDLVVGLKAMDKAPMNKMK